MTLQNENCTHVHNLKQTKKICYMFCTHLLQTTAIKTEVLQSQCMLLNPSYFTLLITISLSLSLSHARARTHTHICKPIPTCKHTTKYMYRDMLLLSLDLMSFSIPIPMVKSWVTYPYHWSMLEINLVVKFYKLTALCHDCRLGTNWKQGSFASLFMVLRQNAH